MVSALISRPSRLIWGVLALLAMFTVPGRGWLAALAMVVTCIGIGRRILESRAAQGLELPGVFGNMFAGMVGWWLISVVLVTLSTFHALSTWSATVLGVIALGVALHYWWRHPPAAGPGFKFTRSVWALALLALAALTPYLIRTLLPDSDWDGALYHLPMAQRFVTDGLWAEGFRPHALYRPGIVQACYAFFHALDLESALIPLNTLAIAATAYLCHQIGRTFWNRQVGAWSAGVLLSSCVLLEFAVDVRVEPFLLLFFMGSIAAGMLWLRERGLGNALVCAMCCGCLAGMKYSGLMYAGLILGPALFACWLMKGLTLQQRLRTSILALLVFAVPSTVFYARNQVLFGNAMHPYKSVSKETGRSHEEMFGKDFILVPKSMRPPPFAVKSMKIEKDLFGQGKPEKRSKYLVLFNAIRTPKAHNSKPFHWVSPWLLVFLLVPAFARDRLSLGFYGFSVGAYFLTITALAAQGDFPVRYLAPLMPVMSIGAGICLARARGRTLVAALALGVALPVFYGSYRQYHYFSYLRPDKYLFGTESELDYLGRVGFNGTIVNPDGTIRFANTAIPALASWLELRIELGALKRTDRMFMVAEAKTSRLPIDCLPSNGNSGRNFLNRLKQADWNYARLRDSLWGEGFRFMLVNKGWMHWSHVNSVVSTEVMVATMHNIDQFVQDQCEMDKVLNFDQGRTLLIPLDKK